MLSGCAPRLSTGEPCERSDSCAAPLVCLLGRCRSECESHRDCTLGGVCLLDQEGRGSCRLPEDERCVSNDACDGLLICVDGACANACTSITDCPDDSRCEAGSDGRTRCVRADAPPLDGGVADTSSDDATLDAGGCAGPLCDPVLDVALTERAACAMTAGGAVWCWGYGLYLGADAPDTCNDQGCASRPVRVRLDEAGMPERDLGGATSLAAGLQNVCAVTEGRVACWGRITGVLGEPGDGARARLVRAAAGGVVRMATDVSVGFETAIARVSDGSVLAWGFAVYGEFGAGAETALRMTASAAPALVPEAPSHLGSWHGCSVVAGVARCWGEDDLGQSSGVVGPLVVEAPTPVAGLPSDIAEVAPARSSSCALTAAGDAWCWGNAALVPESARAASCSSVCRPVPIFRASTSPFVRLARATSAEEACAIDAEGGLWCWGGRMRAVNNDPHRIAGLPPIERAFVGANATCAVDRTGEVWCWGDDELGQLGRGTVGAIGVPDFVPMPVAWRRP